MPAKAQLTCEHCGTMFHCSPSAVASGRKFCGLQCRDDHRASRVPDNRTPFHFACSECGKDFIMMKSYLTAYRKKFSRDPMYCSTACSAAGNRKAAEARAVFTCENCGAVTHNRRKPGGRLYAQQKYCTMACKHEALKKRALEKFETEGYSRHVKRHGYVWISIPALVTGKKHEMLEHRYIMEQSLDRKLLKGETVHHVNGDRSDNRIENLELFSDRHGPGQRVTDKVSHSIDTLELYAPFITPEGWARIDALRESERSHDPTDPTA